MEWRPEPLAIPQRAATIAVVTHVAVVIVAVSLSSHQKSPLFVASPKPYSKPPLSSVPPEARYL
jgi:hypothetical protein